MVISMLAHVVRRLNDGHNDLRISLRGLDAGGYAEGLSDEVAVIEALLRPIDLGLLEEVLQVPERVRMERENEENLAFTLFLPVCMLHGDVEVWVRGTFLLLLLDLHNANRLNALWPGREAGVWDVV